jgi:thymidylate kinase
LFENSILINVSGPDKSGKGHLVALIAHFLEAEGLDIVVQGGESHNAKKMAKPDQELIERLKGMRIVLTEQRTT